MTELWFAGKPQWVGSVVGQRVVSPTLIGRDKEYKSLMQVVGAPPAVVVIEGEAGIGKSRLVAELRDHHDRPSPQLLTGGCRRIREPFPLGPVLEAVGRLDSQLMARELSPVAGALRPLLPELAGWLPPALEPLGDRAAERHRLFRGLAELLRAAGAVVLVLEDLHWADELTREFLGYLLDEQPPQLSVLLTLRGEEAPPGVRAVASRLPTSVKVLQLALAPLDVAQTGALAAAILGAPHVSEEFAAYLCQRASGVPFAIEELLALLQAQGALVRQSAGWTRRTLAQLDVPASIRDAVLERFGGLSEQTQVVMEAAAVLQAPHTASVLAVTSGLSVSQVLSALAQAQSSGLLVEAAGAWSYRHLLAAQAVYSTRYGHRRQELHRRAAQALRALDPVRLGQVAHHLRQAGEVEHWTGVAELAADEASAHGDDSEAVRLLEEVFRHGGLDRDRLGRVAIKLGRAAIETVRSNTEIVALLATAPARNMSRSVRGELQYVMAALLDHTREDMEEERRLWAAAADDLVELPNLRASVMVSLGVPSGTGITMAEHRRWLRCAQQTLAEVAAPDVDVLGKLAMVLVAIGDPSWRPLVQELTARTDAAGVSRAARACNAVGNEATFAGHHQVAAQLLQLAAQGPDTGESTILDLNRRAGRVLFDYCRGRWDGLDQRAEVLLGELANFAPARVDVAAVAGCLALARGSLPRAESLLGDVLQELNDGVAAGAVIHCPQAMAVAGLLRLGLGRGDTAAAMSAAELLLGALAAKDSWMPVPWLLAPVVAALGAVGEHDRAQELVELTAWHTAELDTPLAPPALRFARGHLARVKSGALAAEHFTAAATGYEAICRPYEALQAREQAALVRLDEGNAAAAAWLQEVLAGYEHLGAGWDADRIAAIARKHDVATPAKHRRGRRGYGDALSPREQEVAQLAAAGHNNEQIAASLFVSVKTVEGHVTSVMRKLGIRSREVIKFRLVDAAAQSPG